MVTFPSPAGSAFALLTALLWGVSPTITKRGMERGGSSVQATLFVAGTGLVLFWGALVVRHGIDPLAGLSVRDVAVFLFGGVVGTGAGRLTSYAGIDRVGASINAAVLNSRVLMSTTLAFFLLGEAVSWLTVVGIVVLVVGLVVLSASRGGDVRGWPVSGLLLPLAAAAAYGTGTVVRRFGMTTSAASPLQGAAVNETAALFVLVGYVAVRYRGRLRETLRAPRDAYGFFVLGSVFSALGLLTLFAALAVGRVAVVESLSATSSLFAALFTYVFLRDVERVTRGVVGGAVLVVGGVVLITAV